MNKKNIFASLFILCFGVLFLWACASDEPTADADPEPDTSYEEVEGFDYEVDILVIGGGVSGLTAAVQARYAGATNVAVIETSPVTGGVGISAFGGVNAAESRYQVASGEYGTIEDMINQIMNPGVTHPELVRTMVEASADSIHWFNDHLDAGFTELMPAFAHRPNVGPMSAANSGVGINLVDALNRGLLSYEIPVLLNTTATEILVDEAGAVVGVVAQRHGSEITIAANAVVITAGPPTLPQSVLRDFDQALPGYGIIGRPGTSNSGWELAYNAGAELTVTLRPFAATGVANTDYARELFDAGAVLVNVEGEDFIDVLASTDGEIVTAVQNQTNAAFFVVFNEEMRELESNFERMYDAEIIRSGNTIEELADALGVDVDILSEAIDFDGPFYASPGTANAVTTSAGIRINTDAQVVGRDGNPISGLFAAGVGVGGIQGYGRGGGMSLMEATVFGRISGTSAAAFIGNNFEHTAVTMPHSDELTFAETLYVQGGAEVEVGNFAGIEDGEHTGEASGFGGTIYVTVTVEGGLITEIVVNRHSETALYMMMAQAAVPPQFLELTPEGGTVDAMSGATYSSVGIIEAVKNALGQ